MFIYVTFVLWGTWRSDLHWKCEEINDISYEFGTSTVYPNRIRVPDPSHEEHHIAKDIVFRFVHRQGMIFVIVVVGNERNLSIEGKDQQEAVSADDVPDFAQTLCL